MKVVCAWCQRAGHFVVLREKEPPGDEISHGICDEHALAVIAEASQKPTAQSAAEPVGFGRQLRPNGEVCFDHSRGGIGEVVRGAAPGHRVA